jgi:hypothetical protein
VTQGDSVDMTAILSPAAQIKKKLRRMSVNVMERVTTGSRTNSIDTDASGHGPRTLSRGASASSFTNEGDASAVTAVANPIQADLA